MQWINPCTFLRLEDSLNLIVDNISLPIATERSLFLQILQLEKIQLLAVALLRGHVSSLYRSHFIALRICPLCLAPTVNEGPVFPCSLDALFPGRTSVVSHYTLSLETRHICTFLCISKPWIWRSKHVLGSRYQPRFETQALHFALFSLPFLVWLFFGDTTIATYRTPYLQRERKKT